MQQKVTKHPIPAVVVVVGAVVVAEKELFIRDYCQL